MANNRYGIDYTSLRSGYGSLDDAITNTFYGFNHRGFGNPVPYNTENQGLTFFVRPRLNLSYDNLAMVRKMMPLATWDTQTIQSAIRAYLDPVGNMNRNGDGKTGSVLVDQKNAFITLLSNNLISLNGWPDKTPGTYTSRPGVYRETWSMMDDISLNYEAYNLTANFRNIRGDPITALFDHWVDYQSFVYLGKMMPYPDSVVENEIDYVSRIYRLTLDPTRRFVQKIAACGYCFPEASPIGASINFSNDAPFNQETSQQISIPFKCHGFRWNDPILIYTFNRTVSMFEPEMEISKLRQVDTSPLIRVPFNQLLMLNYYGYPRIEPRTMELQWYVRKEDYRNIIGAPAPDTFTPPVNTPALPSSP